MAERVSRRIVPKTANAAIPPAAVTRIEPELTILPASAGINSVRSLDARPRPGTPTLADPSDRPLLSNTSMRTSAAAFQGFTSATPV